MAVGMNPGTTKIILVAAGDQSIRYWAQRPPRPITSTIDLYPMFIQLSVGIPKTHSRLIRLVRLVAQPLLALGTRVSNDAATSIADKLTTKPWPITENMKMLTMSGEAQIGLHHMLYQTEEGPRQQPRNLLQSWP